VTTLVGVVLAVLGTTGASNSDSRSSKALMVVS
jgi:hypothetical protein